MEVLEEENSMSKKLHKPNVEGGVQKTGKLTGFLVKFFILIDVLLVGMFLIGLTGKVYDLAVVSGILVIVLTGIIVLLKHSYNMSYQENNKGLILKKGNTEYKVLLDNIVDWKPGFNEIGILDKSRSDGKFVNINITILRPEILLRRLADMTFEGKFHTDDKKYFEDPNRERELLYFLVNNKYDYLIKDYIKDNQNFFS